MYICMFECVSYVKKIIISAPLLLSFRSCQLFWCCLLKYVFLCNATSGQVQECSFLVWESFKMQTKTFELFLWIDSNFQRLESAQKDNIAGSFFHSSDTYSKERVYRHKSELWVDACDPSFISLRDLYKL